MAEINYDQSAFTQGELDPRTQARTDWERYYKSAKQIRNCIVIPQGGVQRRFGLTYVATVDQNPVNPLECEISTLLYDNDVIYLLVWTGSIVGGVSTGRVNIYLENILVANVVPNFAPEDILLFRASQVENRLIIVHPYIQPQQLVRSNDANNAITGFSAVNNTLTITNALAVGIILPAQFTTTVSLPLTSPQIFAGRTYFIRAITANTVRIFSTSADAALGLNFYTVTSAGVGVNNLVTQNTWAITNVAFKQFPTFDFNANYFGPTVTFTPSAVSGTITITAANATPFTAAHVGGIYAGNGGIVRITVFTDNQHVTGYTISAFPNTNAIRGDLSLVAEPAWSNNRGWPRTVSFFQNRLVFGGSTSLPNGVWLSVSFDAFNFDDSETLADNAISWYPASGSINFIRALTSGRSLIVHTNTGNYSTPVSQETVWVPTNFTLTEQNKFGVSSIQPVFIDNQIFFTDISGNNIINMLWEFTQSSYVTNNRSIAASSLIRNPVDMAALATPQFIDGFYALFVNSDGTVAMHQTLLEEDVKAWSLANTYSNITNGATSTQVQSSVIRVNVGNTRAWFTVQRQQPTNNSPVNITGFSAINNTLTAAAHGMTVGTPTQVIFGSTGILPTSIPPLNFTNSFWALPIDANTFQVYATPLQAEQGLGVYTIQDFGTNAQVIILQNVLYVEELDFTDYTDCSTKYLFANPTNVLTGLAQLNGQTVQVVGDGFVLQNQNVAGGQIVIERNVLSATVGLQMNSFITTLPITIPQAMGLLYKPKHIRKLMLFVYNTLGIAVQGITVPELQIQHIVFGQVPIPQTGVFEIPIMEGWNSFEYDITISQTLPLPMTLLAISYRIEV